MALESEATGLYHAGRYAEAESRQKEALQYWLQVVPRVNMALAHANLAGVYLAQGRLADAERELAIARRAEEEDPPLDAAGRAWIRTRAARLHLLSGRFKEAVAEQQGALATLAQTEDGASQATILNDLAVMQAGATDWAAARRSFERALEAGGPALDVIWRGRITGNLALACLRQGDMTEAERHYLRALRLLEQSLGADHLHVGMLLAEYAQVLRKTSRKSEAKAVEQRGRAIVSDANLAHGYTVDIHTLAEWSHRRR
jgi:tetratricopeptide (TPR) repeat protein